MMRTAYCPAVSRHRYGPRPPGGLGDESVALDDDLEADPSRHSQCRRWGVKGRNLGPYRLEKVDST